MRAIRRLLRDYTHNGGMGDCNSLAPRTLGGHPFRNVRRNMDFLLRGDAEVCEKNDKARDGHGLLGDPNKGVVLSDEDLLAPPKVVESSKYPIMDLRRYGVEGVLGSVGDPILIVAE